MLGCACTACDSKSVSRSCLRSGVRLFLNQYYWPLRASLKVFQNAPGRCLLTHTRERRWVVSAWRLPIWRVLAQKSGRGWCAASAASASLTTSRSTARPRCVALRARGGERRAALDGTRHIWQNTVRSCFKAGECCGGRRGARRESAFFLCCPPVLLSPSPTPLRASIPRPPFPQFS
jgi:hypothetical protein